MRAFVIADASKRKAKPIGVLLWEPGGLREHGRDPEHGHDHEQGKFTLEISSRCSEDDLPLSLAFCASRENRCATPQESEEWVRSRIVPENRQNIAEVLVANGLAEYDEVSLLAACQGRSSDDDYLVYEIDLPQELDGEQMSAELQLESWAIPTTRKTPRTPADEHGSPSPSRADWLISSVERQRRGAEVRYVYVDLPKAAHGKAPNAKDASAVTSREHDGDPAFDTAARRIAKQIREQRLAVGLTQAQLAARAGITQTVLSRIESGTGNPTLALLEELAGALGAELSISLAKPNSPSPETTEGKQPSA